MKPKAHSPAFLFYTNDFISGTQFFSDEQLGIFIRLLCAQHQHGHLSEKQIMHISKSHDLDVMEKFVTDGEGRFYNIRLEFEINKRENFVASRGKNKEGKFKNDKKIIPKSHDNHVENENEIENKEENKKDKYPIPELLIFLDYCKTIPEINYHNLEFSLKSKYEAWVSDGWKDGNGTKIKNWKTKIKNTIPYLKPMQPTNKGEEKILTNWNL